jgi:predicted O-methyltransferase YrrM
MPVGQARYGSYPQRMTRELWTSVDSYIVNKLVRSDTHLDAALQANSAAGLPPIDVAPNQGKMLHLFARMMGARRILEIGTLGGYSTIWLARALPADGALVTLELDPKHAAVARENIARAGLGSIVDLRIGPAADSLATLVDEGAGPFDFIFIDADKPSNSTYLQWALRLARVGSVIVVDNVVRDGAIVQAAHPDPSVQGTRQFIETLSAEPRVEATLIQTVGSKGYDGFAMCLVVSK